jgi:hydrogenase-4 component E
MIVLLVPLFVGSWRASLLGLAMQGALMGSIALRQGIHLSVGDAITVMDLILLRAVGGPLALYLVLRAQKASPRNDVIAPNLFSWALALALVVVAFRAADILVPAEGDEQMLVAVSCAAFLLGLFVLATSRGTISQIVGVLRVENAIALFELGSASHHESLGIRVAQAAVMFASVGYCRWFLLHLSREESAPTVFGAPL